MDRSAVEESLNYVFTDEAWLTQALTHPSVDQKRITNLNYERLEFLGDAVLELVNSALSPYVEPRIAEDLNLVQ